MPLNVGYGLELMVGVDVAGDFGGYPVYDG